MDCTKAFDLAKFDILFGRLLQHGLPAIVVRVLAFSYQEQVAWVRWGRSCTSSPFGISNRTRQGSVASPAFWSMYLYPLLALLRESGVGCHVGGVYVGVVGYADDILLLAPSREAAQKMIKICKKFTLEKNIQFSTDDDQSKSKSKVIYVVEPRGGGDQGHCPWSCVAGHCLGFRRRSTWATPCMRMAPWRRIAEKSEPSTLTALSYHIVLT